MAAEFNIDTNGVLLGVVLNGETAISLPQAVTEIAAFVFTDKTPLVSLALNAECTTIRNKAFYNCRTLTTLTIGVGLSVLEEYAFAGCNNLSSIAISGSNPHFSAIGNILYSGESAVLGANVSGKPTFWDGTTKIGKRAFSFCDRITELDIPEEITEIGDYAFSDCSGIEKVQIPDKVASVGYGAFFGCSKTVDVTLNALDSSIAETQSLGGRSFAGMEGLKIVHVFSKVGEIGTTIGEETFDGGGRRLYFDIQTSLSDNQYLISHVYGRVGTLGSTITLHFFNGLTEIDSALVQVGDTYAAAMEHAHSLIPDTEDFFGWYFDSQLKKQASPSDVVSNYTINDQGEVEEVTEINVYAKTKAKPVPVEFSRIYYVTITGEPTEKRSYGLAMLTGVKDWELLAQSGYAIPDIFVDEEQGIEYRVTTLGENLFNGGTIAATMSVPWTVKRIGKSAFRGHSELTAVEFPDYAETGKPTRKSQLTTIDRWAFADTGLTAFTVPVNLEESKAGAFEGCDGLATVTDGSLSHWMSIEFGGSSGNPLSNGAKLMIGDTELTTLNPATLADYEKISPFAFTGCSSITSLDMTGNTTVKEIGEEAFSACENLSSVVFSEVVEDVNVGIKVGRAAFSNCGVESIVVPATIIGVGEFMFNGCKKLSEVSVNTKVISSSMFSNCPVLSEVSLEDNVEEIGESAFAGSGPSSYVDWDPIDAWYVLYGGMEIKFSEDSGCKMIGDYAFAKSGVVSAGGQGGVMSEPRGRTIYSPESLKTIGNYAFEGCDGIYYKYPIIRYATSLADNAFENCPHDYL